MEGAFLCFIINDSVYLATTQINESSSSNERAMIDKFIFTPEEIKILCKYLQLQVHCIVFIPFAFCQNIITGVIAFWVL